MIYDDLVDIAHDHLTGLAAMLRDALVLRWPINPHEVLPKSSTPEELARMDRAFRLPHPITVIEDNASCVLLADTSLHAVGTKCSRCFVDCTPNHNILGERPYSDDVVKRIALREATRDVPDGYTVSLGQIQVEDAAAQVKQVSGSLSTLVSWDRGGEVRTMASPHLLPDELYLPMMEAAGKSATTAIEELIHIPHLKRFSGWPSGPGVFDVSFDGEISPRTELRAESA